MEKGVSGKGKLGTRRSLSQLCDQCGVEGIMSCHSPSIQASHVSNPLCLLSMSVLKYLYPLCRSLVISLPTEGHLGSSQILVIVHKAAEYIACCLFCGHKFSNQLGKYTGTQMMHRMLRPCLRFQETTKMFSKVAVHYAFPPAMNQISWCSPSSFVTHIISFFSQLL